MHFVQKLLLSLAQIYKVFVKFLIKAEHKKLFFGLRIEQNNVKYRRFITEIHYIICAHKIKSLFLYQIYINTQ